MNRTREFNALRLIIVQPDFTTILERPVVGAPVRAGFPSPADDYLEKKIDLSKYFVRNPSATYYYWVEGNSMEEAGIFDGDLLVVDNSIEPQNNDIVVAVIDGELTLKQLKKQDGKLYLMPRNSNYSPIEIKEGMSFQVRGVVITSVRPLR